MRLCRAYARGAFDAGPGAIYDFCIGRGARFPIAFLGAAGSRIDYCCRIAGVGTDRNRGGFDLSQVVRHTLRHTAVSHLVQSGVDLPTVKRISGHKTLQMAEKYAHQNDGEHIKAAMDKLQERMARKVA
ncbi:tyrosine-type recombinase/integrase [Variovorax sp. Varisp85]|uniref:tyrosine-type recombinase/integrase n=1 Tax=Variovorax sp. Varisp85 TaxID=3243059 RepID=UPI0039A5C93A